MDKQTLKMHYLSLINQRLSELVPMRDLPQKELFEAARYSLLGPGKRIRPLLALSILHGYHIPVKVGLDSACALECIHTYSLIHDDLPCMDNDDLRRGRPTLHKVFPEGLAVLAGDFLLTFAFDIVVNASNLSSKQKLDLIHSLAKRAGSHGMIGGQVVDLASEGASIDWETLHFMHLHKTAAIFICCLEFGGILSQVNEEDMKTLQHCGKALGVAFQVIDDLLDDYSQESAVCSDITNQKATTVSMLGKQKAEEIAKRLLEEALRETHNLSMPCPLLEMFIKELFEYIPHQTLLKI
jgi:geranylgeranyl diphosphate synthase, type II